jgi:pilus assembly protein CpaE
MSEAENFATATETVDKLEDLILRLEAGDSARQRLVDLLRTGEAKFKLLKSQLPAMLWTMDCQMRFTGVFGARMSYSDPHPTELLGQSLLDYFEVEDPDAFQSAAIELLNRGETAVYEFRHKNRAFQAHIGPLRERGTEVLGGVGVAVEITDRKLAETSLQSSEREYRALFETSEDFIYTFDLDGNFTSANNAARRITGYEVDELRQMNLAQVAAPEYRDTVRLMIESVLGGQPAGPYELEIVAKSGRRLWIEVSPRIQFVNGRPMGFHGVSHEVTERKKAELLERDRNQILELVTKNETLDTILSAINRMVERLEQRTVCSIWQVQEGRLCHAGTSSLPENFVRGFESLRIDPNGWPAAKAASLSKALTAGDIATDGLWEEYRDSALSQRLLASCCLPFFSGAGGVLGVLVTFYRTCHTPDRLEFTLLEAASRLAAAAIEHHAFIDQLSEKTGGPAPQPDAATPENSVSIEVAANPLTIGVLAGSKLLLDQIESTLRGLPVRVVMEASEINDWTGFTERLERFHPEVLLADIGLFGNAVEESVRSIRNSAAAPAVVALHTAADRDMILAVVRAGAREYIYPPVNAHLRRALERMLKDRDARRLNAGTGGKVVGFLSAKGGCGATTIACHIARELQRHTKQEVLLADYDTGAGMVRVLMKANSEYSMLDAAANTHRLDIDFFKALVSNGTPGLDVLAGPVLPNLKTLPKETNFRHILRFVKNHYDWVVVDLGRGLNSLSIGAMEEIDESFVVTTTDLPALLQAKRVVQSLFDEGYGSHRIHLIVNRSVKGGNPSPQELEKMLGVTLYATIPNDAEAVDECYTKRALADPSTPLGRHFAQLAGKISGAKPPEKKKRRFLSLRGRPKG